MSLVTEVRHNVHNTRILSHVARWRNPPSFCVMYASREHLEKRTGSHGVGRFQFLQQLVIEFQKSKNEDDKEQVLANLANFAYDPINYDYIRQLNVIDLFLDMLEEPKESFVEFSIGGLCNLVLDKQNKEYIIANNGVKLIIDSLSRSSAEIIISAVTTLMWLITPSTKADILTVPVIQCMQRLSQSGNSRISNLAVIFLQDYCTSDQIQLADEESSALGIPLPSQPATR
ncbi:armadillo repeat-containing protein 7-like [Saccoglossus kowalevskii]|uniref:Armadillo repeat-containing protein 7-like n=1 Tax=Saccoglossus kowalevskii TaxID=10224 RepID=A0ABM0GJQ3_SACKO|nr:PREDICTED: armadillo repeat-containing protein 7-like [Saccoglossus kowalevskii]